MLHHLDGGTMRPPAGRHMNDGGRLICHVIAFQAAGGVALIDTGIGAAARRHPRSRLGPIAPVLNADRDLDTTIARQLERLGLGPVTDICMTHLDIDHASALDEFPGARVHVHRTELDAALKPALRERTRYIAANWAHGPEWTPFEATDDDFHGFAATTLLDGAVKAFRLPGHSRGHTGYAIRDGDGWFVHAGDAFYDGASIRRGAEPTRYLKVFAKVAAAEPGRVGETQARLTELAQHDDVAAVVCTHDPATL